MHTLSPKQRAIRLRERRILDLALPILASGGLSALSMDAIAEQIQTAKGTIYNHFANKEEILLALAVKAVERRLSLFQQAIAMPGNSRDRVAAVGIACEIYADHFPEMFHMENLIRHENVLEKTSPRRQEVLTGCEGRCMLTVAGVIREASMAGDLQLEPDQKVEDVVLGLWSLVFGGLTLEATSPSLAAIGIEDARRAIRRNCNAMLDGLRWRPLYQADRYQAWIGQVRKHLIQRVQADRERENEPTL